MVGVVVKVSMVGLVEDSTVGFAVGLVEDSAIGSAVCLLRIQL